MKRVKTVDCYEPAIHFYAILEKEFIPACLAGNAEVAAKLSRVDLRQDYEQHREAIDQVVQMATARCAAAEEEASTVVEQRTAWSLGIVCAILGGCGGFGWYTVRGIVNTLRASAAPPAEPIRACLDHAARDAPTYARGSQIAGGSATRP